MKFCNCLKVGERDGGELATGISYFLILCNFLCSGYDNVNVILYIEERKE